jgi:hypothetical protein
MDSGRFQLLEMIDSIESPPTTGHSIPQAVMTAPSVAGYNFGNSWATYGPYCAARPELATAGRIISVALRPPTGGIRSRCFDIEPGGGHNGEIAEFMEHGADRSFGLPILYTYASNTGAMVAAAKAQGYQQGVDFYVWSAHPGGGRHICGPDVCGYPIADLTQFGYRPENCDVSLVSPYVFPSPSPVPVPFPIQEDNMITATTDKDGNLFVFVELDDGRVMHTYQTNGVWHGQKGVTPHKWEPLGNPVKDAGK